MKERSLTATEIATAIRNRSWSHAELMLLATALACKAGDLLTVYDGVGDVSEHLDNACDALESVAVFTEGQRSDNAREACADWAFEDRRAA
jgi:hypothetical protein